MSDMLATVVPKSDQLNFDDLIGGKTLTITVTAVKVSAGTEQPCTINFKGDNGKPYKPCKMMRRALIELWGEDSQKYIGRSMTLYGDPTVRFGGGEVGGIRISHMSDIDGKKTLMLTVSKANKKPYVIQPLWSTPREVKEINLEKLNTDAESASLQGSESLRKWFVSLSPDEKLAIKPKMEDFKTKAKENDNGN